MNFKVLLAVEFWKQFIFGGVLCGLCQTKVDEMTMWTKCPNLGYTVPFIEQVARLQIHVSFPCLLI